MKNFLTYDGLSNVNLRELLNFIIKRKISNIDCGSPPARFGAIKFNKDYVKYFKKNQNSTKDGLIGFVMEPEFLKYIKNDKTFLERTVRKICKTSNLQHKHNILAMY